MGHPSPEADERDLSALFRGMYIVVAHLLCLVWMHNNIHCIQLYMYMCLFTNV